jgi:galactose mutarotase-like enzyme
MNFYTIKNKNFQVSVKKEGAELCSFKSLNTNIEYIWKADPQIWSAHAPNLFPIIGCLKEDSFLYQGKEYACPKHGFIRKNKKISLITQKENSLTFRLKYDDETLKIYPFKFEFQIKFLLEDNKLSVIHKVINHDSDTMLFSLGGHPGFTCPVHDHEEYEDYYLEFEKPETAPAWQVMANGLIGKETQPAFDEPTKIRLHPQIFKNDALVFKNLNSSKVSIKSKKSSQVLSVEFEDFPYLGIWAKPNAPYVCIEPWLGIADSYSADRDFENKEAIISLEAKKDFIAAYSIIIKEYDKF